MEAQVCGVNSFTITGGEPMLHKGFFRILEEIYKRNMFVSELKTNNSTTDKVFMKHMIRKKKV